ncbi:glutamine amidotransferase-like class 1 domain-containing protein 1 [Styela clava]
MTTRPSCLLICSGHTEGVSAQSFINAFTITNSVFVLQVATPQGLPINFVNQDEGSRKWVTEFRTKAYTAPIKVEAVDPSRYSSLLIPSAPGAIHDLAKHDSVMHILRHFVKHQKPICAIGLGVVALAAAKDEMNSWCFKGYSMTGPSVFDLIETKEFSALPFIFEEFARDNLASYTSSRKGCIHTVIDRHLITAQNEESTLSAVQNLLLLSGQ